MEVVQLFFLLLFLTRKFLNQRLDWKLANCSVLWMHNSQGLSLLPLFHILRLVFTYSPYFSSFSFKSFQTSVYLFLLSFFFIFSDFCLLISFLFFIFSDFCLLIFSVCLFVLSRLFLLLFSYFSPLSFYSFHTTVYLCLSFFFSFFSFFLFFSYFCILSFLSLSFCLDCSHLQYFFFVFGSFNFLFLFNFPIKCLSNLLFTVIVLIRSVSLSDLRSL